MLDHTMRRAQKRDLTNITATQGDARRLPYADATCDAAYLVAVLGEIPEQERAMRELAERADVVVTMGCGDECPYIPGVRYVDWELPDPKGRPLSAVRVTRDEIRRRVAALLDDLE